MEWMDGWVEEMALKPKSSIATDQSMALSNLALKKEKKYETSKLKVWHTMEWRLGVSHDMEDLRKSSESPWCAWLAFPFQLYDNLAITRHSEHNWQNGKFQMKIWSRMLNLESRWKFESENPIREDTNGESLKTVLAVKRWKTLERENYSLNTFSCKWTQICALSVDNASPIGTKRNEKVFLESQDTRK